MCACSVAASFSTGTTICTSGSCIARYCAAPVRSAGRARVSGCGMVATFMVASILGAVFKPALSPHIWPGCRGLPLSAVHPRGSIRAVAYCRQSLVYPGYFCWASQAVAAAAGSAAVTSGAIGLSPKVSPVWALVRATVRPICAPLYRLIIWLLVA